MSTPESSSLHAELERELEAARAKLRAVQQRESRALTSARAAVARATAAMHRVQARIQPSETLVEQLQAELTARRAKTLGPWVVCRKYRVPSGNLYFAGRERNCWSNVVWLRVVTSGPPTWTADYRDYSDRDSKLHKIERKLVLLGESGESPRDEFAKLQLVVEERLRACGFYVEPGEIAAGEDGT